MKTLLAIIVAVLINSGFESFCMEEHSDFNDERVGVTFTKDFLYGTTPKYHQYGNTVGVSGVFHIHSETLFHFLNADNVLPLLNLEHYKAHILDKVETMNYHMPKTDGKLWSRIEIDFDNSTDVIKRYFLYHKFWHEQENRSFAFYVPVDFAQLDKLVLDFVPDNKLQYSAEKDGLNYSSNAVFKYQIYKPIMYTVEMDLLSAPHLRGNDLPQNTRFLLSFFSKCFENNYNAGNVLDDCKKFLTREQQYLLTVQLLSIYLPKHEKYNCVEYMELLTRDLFNNIKYSKIKPFIHPNTKNWIDVFSAYLRWDTKLTEPIYDNLVTNFVITTIPNDFMQQNSIIRLNQGIIRPLTRAAQVAMFTMNRKFSNLELKLEGKKHVANSDNKEKPYRIICNNVILKPCLSLLGPATSKGGTIFSNILEFLVFEDLVNVWNAVFQPLIKSTDKIKHSMLNAQNIKEVSERMMFRLVNKNLGYTIPIRSIFDIDKPSGYFPRPISQELFTKLWFQEQDVE